MMRVYSNEPATGVEEVSKVPSTSSGSGPFVRVKFLEPEGAENDRVWSPADKVNVWLQLPWASATAV